MEDSEEQEENRLINNLTLQNFIPLNQIIKTKQKQINII